jgi:hypothetical protein
VNARRFVACIVAILLGALLFTGYVTAPASAEQNQRKASEREYFVPPALEPQLSSDGNTLTYGVAPVVYVDDPHPPEKPLRVPPPFSLVDAQESATATFSITYVPAGDTDVLGEPCYTFPEDAKAAFNAAAAVWGNLVSSSVPITIRACWASLSGSTLGYSGGGNIHANFANAPRANTWYAASLANSFAGYNLAPSNANMHITYNTNFTWYFGTDGNTPAGQHDFMSVVLHEITHGLNFSGSMKYAGGQGSWGSSGYPNIYDIFMTDGSGNSLLNTSVYANPSTALGGALTSNDIWFQGSNAAAANGGYRVKIYAPQTWTSGSSYSHLDYNTFAGTVNRLMVYAIAAGSSIHDPGPVAKGLLKDLGWSISGGVPGPATLISPSGTITTNAPNYTWNAVSEAASYYLWVNDSNGNRIKQWYSAAEAGCGGGTGTCSVWSETALANGSARWWIQTYNAYGYGPWSSAMDFWVAPANLPDKATLISPLGTIITSTPTYTWYAVANANWYYLWVSDSTGDKVKQWYSPAQAGCGGGAGTCSANPGTVLVAGSGKWWIQAYNASGFGPWSDGRNFAVVLIPPTATLVSPSGTITTNAPTYTWNAVANATWYYLWVDDSSGNKIKQWYTAAQAGCGSGTGTCAVWVETALAAGAAKWWIQTYNAYGYGLWSTAMNFTVAPADPPGKAVLISPSGTIVTATPTYIWNAVANSNWYYLWVYDNTGYKIKQWYSPTQAGCGGGSGTCAATPGTPIAAGADKWWIQTYNGSGFGPWSNGMVFTVGAGSVLTEP